MNLGRRKFIVSKNLRASKLLRGLQFPNDKNLLDERNLTGDQTQA